jgi:hypothetical protein
MEETGRVELLKVDTKGRVRVSRQRREALLGEYDRSSMSAAAFAEWVGVKYPTFAGWLQERRRAEGRNAKVERGRTSAGMSWVEAVVEEGHRVPKGSAGLVIELGGCGARMEVNDAGSAELAAEVLRRLGGSGRC